MAKSDPQSRETASEGSDPSVDELTFEQAMEELEAIIDRIEQGQIGLEDSLAQRKRGDVLIKRCRAVLDTAEQELENKSTSQQVNKSTDQQEGGSGR